MWCTGHVETLQGGFAASGYDQTDPVWTLRNQSRDHPPDGDDVPPSFRFAGKRAVSDQVESSTVENASTASSDEVTGSPMLRMPSGERTEGLPWPQLLS